MLARSCRLEGSKTDRAWLFDDVTETLSKVTQCVTEQLLDESVPMDDDDERAAERAFHSVHDLVHYAILSQPTSAASLRMIYSICQKEGRIASKHGNGSRLITANEHWKSQIRHALYTSPRFRRLGNDDWGVAAGHQVMPDTTTVFVSKAEKRSSATSSAPSSTLGGKCGSPPPKSLKKRRMPRMLVTGNSNEMPSWEADDYRSSAEPETVSMSTLEGDPTNLKLMRTASGAQSGSAHSARSTETRIGRAEQREFAASPKTRTPSRSPSRSPSTSPEPRESSTLVVVAGLLEQYNGKVTFAPRDFRRNRRKPVGGGHHAAMPADSECRVDGSTYAVASFEHW